MKHIRFPAIVLGIGFLLAGCGQPPSSKPILEENGEDSSVYSMDIPGHAWSDTVFVGDMRMAFDVIPLKKECDGQSLQIVFDPEWPNRDIVVAALQPQRIDFIKRGKFAKVFDVIFSADCSSVYVLASRPEDERKGIANDMYRYDIASTSWTKETDGLSMLWKDLETAQPAVKAIYPIDGRHLLLDAMNPNTGSDSVTNMSTQYIYDTSTHEVSGLPPAGVSADETMGFLPVIYDYDTHVISFVGGDRQSLIRRDLNLVSGDTAQETFFTADEYAQVDLLNALPCSGRNYFKNEYIACMNKTWETVFPK